MSRCAASIVVNFFFDIEKIFGAGSVHLHTINFDSIVSVLFEPNHIAWLDVYVIGCTVSACVNDAAFCRELFLKLNDLNNARVFGLLLDRLKE